MGAIDQFESISIEGLRGFSETQTLKLAQPNGKPGSGITYLVGANNSGKSTIVEAFNFLSRLGQGEDGPSLTEGRRNISSPKVDLRLTLSSEQYFGLSSIRASGSITQWYQSDSFQSANMATLGSTVLVLPSRRTFMPYFDRHYSSERAWQIYSEVQRIQDYSAFAGRLFNIASTPSLKASFDELFKEVIGEEFVWDIELSDHGQYYLKVIDGAVRHSSEGLGEGLVSLLFILDAIYDTAEKGITVIDEPELSLHPQVLRRLNQKFIEFSKSRQLVIATHSPYLVSWQALQAGATVARVVKEGNQSIVYQPKAETVYKIASQHSGGNAPYLFGIEAVETLFLKDGLLLVEGVDDLRYYPIAFRELGYETALTFHGWSIGGASKAEAYNLLFRELGYKSVVTILDADQQGLVSELQAAFPDYLFLALPAEDIIKPKACNLVDCIRSHIYPRENRREPHHPGLLEKKRGSYRILPEFQEQFRDVVTRLGRYETRLK